ncbi:Acg family FMN-binding oxidoreductase [Aestuariivita boseongensis]|uniref:Acg family FMN-binding oxidoreductase n=1 Tax=Aestuariivita boseongensis TaxID=1470562 RepID=UPI000681FC3C|nr:Tat pathway signal protein [Aestuariivita boseongensis]
MAHITKRAFIAAGVSVAALGAVGYGLWPRMDGYRDEVERQRRLLGSDPDLRELVRMATLAPNGHNTQPWTFRLAEDSLNILPDFTRRTQVVDPDDHHIYVSLGCAAENLATAAAAHGRAADITIRTDQAAQIDVAFSPTRVQDGPFYQAIPLRQSTRSVYDGQPVSAEDLRLLETAAREDGVNLLMFTARSDLDAILDFVIAGNTAQVNDPAFVQELQDWIRFSPARALETGDGLFSACSGNPVSPEFIGSRLFRSVFKTESENRKYTDHVKSSAGIAVFVGDSDTPENWIKVGRSFERFALQATALGIRNAHLNMPVEVLSVRPDFADWLGVPGMRPNLVIRFGRAPALPMSLRRPVEAVLV